MPEEPAKPQQKAEGSLPELALPPPVAATIPLKPDEGEERRQPDRQRECQVDHVKLIVSLHRVVAVACTILLAGRSVAWLNARGLGPRDRGFKSLRPDLSPLGLVR